MANIISLTYSLHGLIDNYYIVITASKRFPTSPVSIALNKERQEFIYHLQKLLKELGEEEYFSPFQ